jgi:hypothetical protein
MESLGAKLNKLKAAWEEFSMGILNSDLVKTGVDILTSFITLINNATKGFGGLSGSLMKILTVIGMFKVAQKLFAKIKNPIMSALTEIVSASYVKGQEAAKKFGEGV